MIAKPWSHKQKDRHSAVSPRSDQVFGVHIESLRPHFTITLNAIWRFWATSIALRDIAGALWRVKYEPLDDRSAANGSFVPTLINYAHCKTAR